MAQSAKQKAAFAKMLAARKTKPAVKPTSPAVVFAAITKPVAKPKKGK